MDRTQLSVPAAGGDIVGWVEGSGLPVLLLHGGPVGYEYLEGLAAEFLPGFAVAAYQQRGVSPSTLSGPFDMETETADAKVCPGRAWLGPDLCGGALAGRLLALQLCRRLPDRVLGALIVDPLGAVGDGGFDESEYTARPAVGCRPPRRRDRSRGWASAADDDEFNRLVWPTYFADSHHTSPFALRAAGPTHGPFRRRYSATCRCSNSPSDLRHPDALRAWQQKPDAGLGVDRHGRVATQCRARPRRRCRTLRLVRRPGSVRAAFDRLVAETTPTIVC